MEEPVDVTEVEEEEKVETEESEEELGSEVPEEEEFVEAKKRSSMRTSLRKGSTRFL